MSEVFSDLIYERRGPLCWITLNRPRSLNSLGPRTAIEVLGALETAIADDEARVIIITGAGEGFCSGGDFKEVFSGALNQSLLAKRRRVREGFNRVIMRLQTSEKPVIAAVNGAAIGGGCNFALACDIRIASQRARFGQVFVNLGATPELGGTFLLSRIIGLGRAIDLVFRGAIIDAEEALRIGLVTRVVAPDQLKAEAERLGLELASKSAPALGLAKTLLTRGLAVDLPTALEMEAMALTIAFETAEHKEAVKRFLEASQQKKAKVRSS